MRSRALVLLAALMSSGCLGGEPAAPAALLDAEPAPPALLAPVFASLDFEGSLAPKAGGVAVGAAEARFVAEFPTLAQGTLVEILFVELGAPSYTVTTSVGDETVEEWVDGEEGFRWGTQTTGPIEVNIRANGFDTGTEWKARVTQATFPDYENMTRPEGPTRRVGETKEATATIPAGLGRWAGEPASELTLAFTDEVPDETELVVALPEPLTGSYRIEIFAAPWLLPVFVHEAQEELEAVFYLGGYQGPYRAVVHPSDPHFELEWTFRVTEVRVVPLETAQAEGSSEVARGPVRRG